MRTLTESTREYLKAADRQRPERLLKEERE
jgi:hypothetical protein